MPNWCSNEVTVTGKVTDVEAFIKKAEGKDHRFVGPFNGSFMDRKAEDWDGFDTIKLDILMAGDESLFTSHDSSPLSFHALYPVPREVALAPYDPHSFEKRKEQYPGWFRKFPDIVAGYAWENTMWGCKWGASDPTRNDIVINGEEASVTYHFSTAWGPPIEFFNKVAADFSSLHFSIEYEEPGVGFAGCNEWEEGVCVRQEEWEYRGEEEEEEED